MENVTIKASAKDIINTNVKETFDTNIKEKVKGTCLVCDKPNFEIHYKNINACRVCYVQFRRNFILKNEKMENIVFNFQSNVSIINIIFLGRNFAASNEYLPVLKKGLISFENFEKRMQLETKEDTCVPELLNFCHDTKYLQRFLINTARMLMDLPEFAILIKQEKWKLFNHFWGSFFVLLKFYNLTNNENKNIFSTDKQSNDKSSINACKLYLPICEYLEKNIYFPMQKLILNKKEITWMILQMLYANTNFSEIMNGGFSCSKRELRILRIIKKIKVVCEEQKFFLF
uniref:NR LBD domain-containing protein n=1 Tax=Rhabditophanes sp. KR3021 TaxID=114890 RepID=A0AC35UE57_9BILA